MSNCNVCFENLLGKKIKCIELKCDSVICLECMEDYIFSSDNVPKCVKQDCNHPYTSTQIKDVSGRAIQVYNELCLNDFLNKNDKEIKDTIAKAEIIENIRENRKATIKTFPIAIAGVINMCMKPRLNKITKVNAEIVDNIIKGSGRFCMLSYCRGKLNSDFKCLKCESQFCKDCEKIKKDGHGHVHICKESDLNSIKYIKNIGQCPTCSIYIEKSEGCRHMKCANCHTMFDYYTGQVTDHGGHNSDVNVKDELRLSSLYKDFYDEIIILALRDFEKQRPPNEFELKHDRILKYVTDYVTNDKKATDVYADRVARLFDSYTKMKYDYVLYMKKISEIQDLHESGKLLYDKLLKVIYT